MYDAGLKSLKTQAYRDFLGRPRGMKSTIHAPRLENGGPEQNFKAIVVMMMVHVNNVLGLGRGGVAQGHEQGQHRNRAGKQLTKHGPFSSV
jgi:hypothetical protein